MARSPILDGVDPRLVNLLNQVGEGYKPYGMRLVSGYRPAGGRGGQGYHPKGSALDVELFDRATGEALKNYQDPKSFAAYQQFANTAYGAADPELQKQLRWGGYFSGPAGKYGALDLMHFDLGGAETPMGGGSWAGGLTPDQAKLWNLQAGGGLQQGPAMPKNRTDYTPEQRRNAIAAIESAGSGDYAALGPEIARRGGAGPGVKDRAYGRYQVMGANIPAWTKEVLGREMTPQEFLADPKAQDAVFDKKFGDYVAKHGEAGAASMWFTGRPDAPQAKDALGTSGASYIDKYLNSLGKPVEGAPYPDQKTPAGAPAAAGTPVAGADKTKPENKIDTAIAGMADSLGSVAGAGSGGRQQPLARAAPPTASPTFSEAGQLVNPQVADAQRQQLAMALQRLNSGKLWV